MEKKMETTGFRVYGLGLGLCKDIRYWDNGKENGNYCSVLGI